VFRKPRANGREDKHAKSAYCRHDEHSRSVVTCCKARARETYAPCPIFIRFHLLDKLIALPENPSLSPTNLHVRLVFVSSTGPDSPAKSALWRLLYAAERCRQPFLTRIRIPYRGGTGLTKSRLLRSISRGGTCFAFKQHPGITPQSTSSCGRPRAQRM
jgi:hypothetical protein